jgi:hypothetical protein
MALALQNILPASPSPSEADIVCEGKDVAWKLLSCGDVFEDNNDNGANDDRWF